MTISNLIEEDEVFKEFVKDKELKKNSIENYIYSIKQFCEFTGKTPTELIESAEAEEDKGVRKRRREIRKLLNDYRVYLEERKKHGKDEHLSPATISHHMVHIRSFYAHFDIELPKNKPVKRNETEIANTDDLLPTLDDIKYALEFANLQYKAIIKLQMSSGMGRAEVLSLKITDFLNAVKDYYDISIVNTPDDIYEMCKTLLKMDVIPTWQVKRVKINYPYFTFSNPESVTAICDYLIRNPPKNLDSYLFRYLDKGVEKRIHNGSFIKYFERLSKNCGFEKKDGRNLFRSHNIRKFFASTLLKNGMSKWDIDSLLGHRQKDQDGSYFKQNIDALKILYMQHMKCISLEKIEYRHFDSPEYKAIVKGQAEMQADLNAQREEINSQREEMLTQMTEIKKQQELLEKKQKELAMEKIILDNKDNPEFKKILEELKKSK